MKWAIGRRRIAGCGTFGRALVLDWFSIVLSGGTYKQVSQQEVAKLRKLLTKWFLVKYIASVCVHLWRLQSYRDSNVGDTWWAQNLGVHSETVLCFLVGVIRVVKACFVGWCTGQWSRSFWYVALCRKNHSTWWTWGMEFGM